MFKQVFNFEIQLKKTCLCCDFRLRNVEILVSYDNNYFVSVAYKAGIFPGAILDIDVPHYDAPTRFVRVQLKGNNEILTLCEVRLFGTFVRHVLKPHVVGQEYQEYQSLVV